MQLKTLVNVSAQAYSNLRTDFEANVNAISQMAVTLDIIDSYMYCAKIWPFHLYMYVV